MFFRIDEPCFRAIFSTELWIKEREMSIKITYGDKYKPKEEWQRPERIKLIAEMLESKGVPEVFVFLGGERFQFSYGEQHAVMDVRQTKQLVTVSAYISTSRTVFRRPHKCQRNVHERLHAKPRPSQADICAAAKKIVEQI